MEQDKTLNLKMLTSVITLLLLAATNKLLYFNSDRFSPFLQTKTSPKD